MTTYPYVVLSDSDAGTIKRFRVVKMSTPVKRTDNFAITLGGKVDKSAGALLDYFMYTFKVAFDADDPDYGSLGDLDYFFRLNSPNATPSDLLVLTDHYGTNHNVKFQDDMAPEPITTQLEGPNAWHYINVTFVKISTPGGSGS